jgi:protoporphyrinogen/coproporphyrinogen III oxidase
LEITRRKVVIIGGGITGLATAYYLQKAIKEQKLSIDVKLIEANRKLGGKIQTIRRDGFVIERGPDSFLDRQQSAARLAENVGLKHSLVSIGTGKSYVIANGKLFSIPKGALMGIPTKWTPFIASNLFSIAGKFRAAADLIIPRSKKISDQSLGSFFRRRLGNEVVENLIEPLLSRIYASDVDQLSLMSTLPQYYQTEVKYRSLLLGMKKSAFQPLKEINPNKESGPLLTLKDGLESLVKALESHLEPSSILKGIRVESIRKRSNKSSYHLQLNNGEKIEADSVVVTIPHYFLTSLFPDQEIFFKPLSKVPSTSVATVTMAFPEEAIKKDIDGIGFFVSRNSDYSITACSWTHKKWPHTTPKGNVLLRCNVGRAGDETIVDLSDAEIEQIVLDDLNKTMKITGQPDFTIVSRWKNAIPQYTVGHKERIQQLESYININLPGVFLGGSSFKGIGIPECIDQGEEAAQKVVRYSKCKQ